jgi:hypothetical protein
MLRTGAGPWGWPVPQCGVNAFRIVSTQTLVCGESPVNVEFDLGTEPFSTATPVVREFLISSVNKTGRGRPAHHQNSAFRCHENWCTGESDSVADLGVAIYANEDCPALLVTDGRACRSRPDRTSGYALELREEPR